MEVNQPFHTKQKIKSMKKIIISGLLYTLFSAAIFAQDSGKKPDTTRIQLGKYQMIIVEEQDGNTTINMKSENKDGTVKEKTFRTDTDSDGNQIIISEGDDGTKTIRIEEEVEDVQDEISDRLDEAQDKLEDAQDRLEDKMEELNERMEAKREKLERKTELKKHKNKHKKLVITKHKKKYKLYSNWGGLSVGYETFLDKNNTITDAELFNTDRSYSLRWEFYRLSMHLGTPYAALTSGLSWGGSYIPLKDNAQLESDENKTWITKDATRSYSKNKLVYTYLEVPVFLELFTSTKRKSNLRISAGLINKFRLNSKAKYEYTKEGKDISTTVKDDFNLFKYSPELSARLGYKGVGIFANAAMAPFFKKDKGPEAKTFTVGLNFSFPVIKSGRAYRG